MQGFPGSGLIEICPELFESIAGLIEIPLEINGHTEEITEVIGEFRSIFGEEGVPCSLNARGHPILLLCRGYEVEFSEGMFDTGTALVSNLKMIRKGVI